MTAPVAVTGLGLITSVGEDTDAVRDPVCRVPQNVRVAVSHPFCFGGHNLLAPAGAG